MKKRILFLVLLFVVLPEVAWAHTPPRSMLETLPTLLILVFLVGLTYIGGGYKILQRIKKTTSVGRIVQYFVIFVIFLYCISDRQLFAILTVIIGVVSLIRSASLIRWGLCSSDEKKRKAYSPLGISFFLGSIIVLLSGVLLYLMEFKFPFRSDDYPAIITISLIFLLGMIITVISVQRTRKREKPKVDPDFFADTQSRRLYFSGGTLAIATLLLAGTSIYFISL